MGLLAGYIRRTVFFAILVVLLVIVAVDVIAAIIDEAGDMKVNYGFDDVLIYVFTTLPGRIYQNIPFSALIGCLLGLGVLASNSELIVMRSAGVSLGRIVSFVLQPVMIFIIAAALLGEFVVPYTEQLAEGKRAIELGRQDRMSGTAGLWNKENNDYIHVAVVFPSGDLYGVSHYRFDDNQQLQEASFAASASFQGEYWLEKEVVVTEFKGDDSANGVVLKTVVTNLEERRWQTALSPQLLRLVLMDAVSLPVTDLFDYGNYLQDKGQNAGRHWLAFWQKVLQPLTILSLVLIAVSFIFGPLRNSTTGLRIFAGVVTGIIFSTSQDLLGPASLVYGFSPFWAVFLPVCTSVAVGGLLLKRAA